MAIGFGVLKLSSREFWALTPRELAAAIEGLTARPHAPMDRAAFEDLARRFPDADGNIQAASSRQAASTSQGSEHDHAD